MINTMMRIAAWSAALACLSACLPGQMSSQSGRQAPSLVVAPGEPVLQVGIPKLGTEASLKRIGVNGGVETWMSGDGVSVSLNQGVIVATRGLGFDLMAADVGNTLAAMAAGGMPDPYRRQMRYLTADNHARYLSAGCRMTLERDLFTETCATHSGHFTNTYPLTGQGSRQWVSPEIGYLKIRLAAPSGLRQQAAETTEIRLEP